MDENEIQNTIYSWEETLSDRRRRTIHYQSIRNFLSHMNEISSDVDKQNIYVLLGKYIEEVQARDYDFETKESFSLADTFITPIGRYFRKYSNFAALLRLRIVLVVGIVGDGILYLTHLSDKFWHFPIVTFCLFVYYLLLKIFKQSRGRMYGYQY